MNKSIVVDRNPCFILKNNGCFPDFMSLSNLSFQLSEAPNGSRYPLMGVDEIWKPTAPLSIMQSFCRMITYNLLTGGMTAFVFPSTS